MKEKRETGRTDGREEEWRKRSQSSASLDEGDKANSHPSFIQNQLVLFGGGAHEGGGAYPIT